MHKDALTILYTPPPPPNNHKHKAYHRPHWSIQRNADGRSYHLGQFPTSHSSLSPRPGAVALPPRALPPLFLFLQFSLLFRFLFGTPPPSPAQVSFLLWARSTLFLIPSFFSLSHHFFLPASPIHVFHVGILVSLSLNKFHPFSCFSPSFLSILFQAP